MAQLPGTIHIKRKLVEEPPDTLYIEREGYDSSLDENSARPVYRLVQATKRPRISHDSHPNVLADPTPDASGAKTPAETANDLGQTSRSSSILIKVQEDQAKPINSPKAKSQKLLQARRIFHLAVTKGSALSRVSSTSSIHSLSKRRSKHGSGIAVFTERKVRRVDQMARTIISSRPGTPSLAEDESSIHSTARKRPSASTQTPKIPEPPSILHDKQEDVDANLKLAAELQQFTLETLPSPSYTAQPTATPNESFRKKPMKYQPRPPPQRHTRTVETTVDPFAHQSLSTTGDTVIEDTSDEWVYDVYIRDVSQPLTQTKSQSAELQPNGNSQDENVGVIVIRQEDEAALEEFMSDDSGSEGWGEEDEDSNAEDYYANDYPDELDSDDEWNAGLRSDGEDGVDYDYHLSDGERD